MKTTSGDIIISRNCTINEDHMMYGKNEEKTAGDIIILHMCNINDNHMLFCF